jgi:DNA-binding response OmpR family regulator
MDKKIMVVTQDNTLSLALNTAFEREGGMVQSCNNSKDALEQAITWLPQLLIIDGALPGKESLKICRNLKRLPELGTIPIIILGQVMNSRAMSSAYNAGADFYVLNQGEDRRALLLTAETIFRLQTNNMTAA